MMQIDSTGHGNEDAQYTMCDTVLNTTVKEKDLGLTISADMKVSEQCGIAAAKGNQILGLIRRNIVYKEKELIIQLYKIIVRPHLEYCTSMEAILQEGYARKSTNESNKNYTKTQEYYL